MTWGIGANDVASAMGTSVGSGAITVRQALVLAGIMEFAGAYLAGGEVADTISKGIIDGRLFEPVPQLLVLRHDWCAAGSRHLADGRQHARLAGVDHASIVGAVAASASRRSALTRCSGTRWAKSSPAGSSRRCSAASSPAADHEHPQADFQYRRSRSPGAQVGPDVCLPGRLDRLAGHHQQGPQAHQHHLGGIEGQILAVAIGVLLALPPDDDEPHQAR
jgi:hypothetical protein